MVVRKTVVLLTALMVLLAMAGVQAEPEKVISKSFPKKEMVRIKTVSGNCTVIGDDVDEIHVEVAYRMSPQKAYEPRFRERDDVLTLTEVIHGSCSGDAEWTVTVPRKTELRFSSASGGMDVSNVEAEISVETASGGIEVGDCKGHLDLSSASGGVRLNQVSGRIDVKVASGSIRGRDLSGEVTLQSASGSVRVDNARGELQFSSASGSVDASGIVLEEVGTFEAASGNVYVELAESAQHDLHLSSASGRAVLDYGDNPLVGQFSFVAKVRKGRIDAPMDFDDEDEFSKWGDRYVRKVAVVDKPSPEISIETASGRARLVKK
ncbi:MAG: DUF4097 domain-containing protein [candidate division Zixibacteria bacterium]|nr:DUF4097 domain-containing protein [candidate division Zixibacteria bacterium]